MAIKLKYSPTIKTEKFTPGCWAWLSRKMPTGQVNPCAGVIICLASGALAAVDDRWHFSTGKSGGLTVMPSLDFNRGGADAWHGWIKDGYLLEIGEGEPLSSVVPPATEHGRPELVNG